MARSPVSKAISTTYSIADKSAGAAFRYITTDHFGVGRHLANIPVSGFMATLTYIVAILLGSLVGILTSAGIVYVAIAHGIPAMFDLLYPGL